MTTQTQTNPLIDQISQFPPNLCAWPANAQSPDGQPIPIQPPFLSVEQQKKFMLWMFNNYVFPQVQERQTFEAKWDQLHSMYKIEEAKKTKLTRRKTNSDRAKDDTELEDPVTIGDTIIFDTVDRLKNLNHFISWKDGVPVQFNRPRFLTTSLEDEFYKPTANKIIGANALIEWNAENQEVYLKHLLASQHFYLYGLVFCKSDIEFEVSNNHIEKFGVTFEPTSIRKVWLNYRLPLHRMQWQPCPFTFEDCPRFTLQGNTYNPSTNPLGYANLDKLGKGQFMMGMETESWTKAMNSSTENGGSLYLGRPEFSTEAKWTFYPMMPLNEAGDIDETAPMRRFVVEVFSSNLSAGSVTPIRIQEDFYPEGVLPLFGVSHIPDLDSGAYAPSIAELLESHYDEIVKAKKQFLDNKNWINNPPSWVVSGSPAMNADLNKPNAKIEVLGPNDFGWRTPFDATGSTIQFMAMARDNAQTTGKAVDALLGKAMGSRTTATEASNAFQAAMSGATTDINLLNNGLMRPFALRIWLYFGKFADPDLIKRITGQFGTALTKEDFAIKIGITSDVGSSFIESVVRQQHLRYALEAATRSPHLRQDVLWKAFFKELKLPEAMAAVMDNGFEFQVQTANEQAIQTYLGKPIIIDPSQDHETAIKVKTRYLQDHTSGFNIEYGAQPSAMPSMISGQQITRAQAIAEQIQMHTQFRNLEIQQEMLQQQIAMNMQMEGGGSGSGPSSPVGQPEMNMQMQNSSAAATAASMQGGRL